MPAAMTDLSPEEILGRALELEPHERAAFLDEACAGNVELRTEIESLLAVQVSGLLEITSEGSAVCAGPRPDEEITARIGPYPILGELGRGGMGVVYLAEDPKLKRRIALKVLPARFRRDPSRLELFRREARLLAAINHPNIATIYSFEDAARPAYFTMELVSGKTLADRLRDDRLTLDESLSICRQTAAALEAAQKQGVVHRDLKPSNIMVGPDGQVKVLDFGVAIALQPKEQDRRTGPFRSRVAGTPGYMSPEQARGTGIDHRTDIWALGCILYECLSAQPAFPVPDVIVRNQATLQAAPDWDALPRDIPELVRSLLVRCLRKEPDERPESAAAVRRDLEEVIAQRLWSRLPPASFGTDARAPGATRSGNLPYLLDSFVGREREMNDVRSMLQGSRLLTLVGAGGCGKTRLAVETGSTLLGTYPEGVWLAKLAPVRDPERVPQTVLLALGLKEERGRSVSETLVDSLQGKAMLLILDNCEHLLGATAELVEAVLGACPGLHVLATSRERLGVPGETLYHVFPLAVPDPGERSWRNQVACEALQLFLERAAAVRPGFAATQETTPFVVEICRRLDGIPLALELAAARIEHLSPREIAERLDDRFRLLSPGRRTSPPHQQTLQASIDWSYEQLSAEERAFFRRLSVFDGGWTLEAAEAVCTIAETEARQVLELLSSLVGKCLVEFDPAETQATGKTRHRMLETVREYARDRLARSGESSQMAQRHRDYFVSLAEAAAGHLRGREQSAWLTRLSAEQANLAQALDHCLEAPAEFILGARLVAALFRYWVGQGRWREGRRFCEALLDRAGAQERTPEAAKVLRIAGQLANLQGDTQASSQFFRRSLSVERELDNPRGVAISLDNLGLALTALGDWRQARTSFEESLALIRGFGDRHLLAVGLNNLGNVTFNQGDYEEARACYGEGLVIFQELGDRWGEAIALGNLASVAERQEDYSTARRHHEASLPIKRELGDRPGIAISIYNLGTVAGRQGDFGEARRCLTEALDIQRELEDRWGEANTLRSLGWLAQQGGNLTEAGRLYRESLEIRGRLGDPAAIAESLVACGLLAASSDEPARAARLLARAEVMREEAGTPLDPDEQRRTDACLSAIRARLGEQGFAREWTAGRAASVAEAVALALLPVRDANFPDRE